MAHNECVSKLPCVNLFFSYLCFCEILFEFVYSWESYRKNKWVNFFIETQCIKKNDSLKIRISPEDPREPISTKFGTAGRLADLITHDNFLGIDLGVLIL